MLVEANLINTSYEPEYTDIYECLSSREAVQEDLYIAKMSNLLPRNMRHYAKQILKNRVCPARQ